MAVLAALRAMAARLPTWAWVLIVALAWGSWQHHRAKAAGEALLAQQQLAAQAHAAQLEADQAETARRLSVQTKVSRDAQTQTQAAQAAASAAADAAGRLRQRLAAVQADAGASAATAAGGCPSTTHTAGVPADLLWRAVEAAGRYAAIADQRGTAGQACERAYQALTP